MNITEAFRVMEALNTFYPSSKSYSEEHAAREAKFWFEAGLRGYGYVETMSAVKRIAITRKWKPSLAELIEEIESNYSSSIKSTEAACAHIRSLVMDYGVSNRNGALEKMDEVEREAVQTFGWNLLCSADNHSRSKIYKDFSAVYEAELSKARKQRLINRQNQLPTGVNSKLAAQEALNEPKRLETSKHPTLKAER